MRLATPACAFGALLALASQATASLEQQNYARAAFPMITAAAQLGRRDIMYQAVVKTQCPTGDTACADGNGCCASGLVCTSTMFQNTVQPICGGANCAVDAHHCPPPYTAFCCPNGARCGINGSCSQMVGGSTPTLFPHSDHSLAPIPPTSSATGNGDTSSSGGAAARMTGSATGTGAAGRAVGGEALDAWFIAFLAAGWSMGAAMIFF